MLKNLDKAILIIDDDEDILDLIAMQIQAGELKIYTAQNYAAAQDILSSHAIDIILTDLNLGTLKATTFIDEIKAHYKDVPVLLMTAMPSDSLKSNHKSLGFADIVAKPISSDNLLNTIINNLS